MWQLLAIFWKRLSQLDVEPHLSSSPCVVATGYFQKSTQDTFHLSNCLLIQYICFLTCWKIVKFFKQGQVAYMVGDIYYILTSSTFLVMLFMKISLQLPWKSLLNLVVAIKKCLIHNNPVMTAPKTWQIDSKHCNIKFKNLCNF